MHGTMQAVPQLTELSANWRIIQRADTPSGISFAASGAINPPDPLERGRRHDEQDKEEAAYQPDATRDHPQAGPYRVRGGQAGRGFGRCRAAVHERRTRPDPGDGG